MFGTLSLLLETLNLKMNRGSWDFCEEFTNFTWSPMNSYLNIRPFLLVYYLMFLITRYFSNSVFLNDQKQIAAFSNVLLGFSDDNTV